MEADSRTVEAGVPFRHEMASIPSTGYEWRLVSAPEGVELIRSGIESPDGQPHPGSSLTQVFELRVRDPGEFDVLFALQRPWERTPARSRTLHLRAV